MVRKIIGRLINYHVGQLKKEGVRIMKGDLRFNVGNVIVEGDTLDADTNKFTIGKRPKDVEGYYLSAEKILSLLGEYIYIGGHSGDQVLWIRIDATKINMQNPSPSGSCGILIEPNADSVALTGDKITLTGKSINIGEFISDRVVALTGDKITLTGHSVVGLSAEKITLESQKLNIGGRSGGKYFGIEIAPDARSISVMGSLLIRNPLMSPPDTKARVAMQQDDHDSLVFNSNGAFTGGVRIEGGVRIGGETHLMGPTVFDGDLNLSGDRKINVKTTVPFIDPRTGRPKTGSYNLLETLGDLSGKVAELEKKLAEQEKLKKLVPGW